MKKKDYKISVIVPIYNVEKYLEKCIFSICNQTYSNLEILLIDDGSSDNCGKICDKNADKDKRIKVFHIKNSGQSSARNKGLEAASGDFIGFVDGDDWIRKDMYEIMLYTLINNKADIVECNFHGRKEMIADKIENGKIYSMSGKKALEIQLNARIPSRFPSTSLWSKLFRKDLIQEFRLPDGRIHEEYAFLCKALYKAKKYVYLNEYLYERVIRKDSTTAEQFSKRTLDKIYVYQQRNTFLQEMQESQLYRLSKEQEYALLLHYAGEAASGKLQEEEKLIVKLIYEQKKEIFNSNISFKKKVQYLIFFMNNNLYYSLRNGMKING